MDGSEDGSRRMTFFQYKRQALDYYGYFYYILYLCAIILPTPTEY